MASSRKPSVKLVHGKATTTSLKIAEAFGKVHRSVLSTIRHLQCSPEFTEHNFVLSEYIDPTGRKLPMYIITRDGFAFLASGFTGREAAQWKEKYIEAFNRLEQHALDKAAAKRAPKALPPPARTLPPVRYHYPRHLLEQPHFTTDKIAAGLNVSMLGNTTEFVSPLLCLLNQLRTEGHDIGAPWAEAVALREGIQTANKTLDEISMMTSRARFKPADAAK